MLFVGRYVFAISLNHLVFCVVAGSPVVCNSFDSGLLPRFDITQRYSGITFLIFVSSSQFRPYCSFFVSSLELCLNSFSGFFRSIAFKSAISFPSAPRRSSLCELRETNFAAISGPRTLP